MLAREVVFALHLDEATHGALELEGEAVAAVELCGWGGGGDDEVPATTVQLLYERDEATGFVLEKGVEYGYARDDDGLILASDFDVVVLTAGSGAHRKEIE